MNEPTPAPLADERQSPPADDKPAPTGSGRFALYDKTELRFVGSVVDSRKAANAAANHDKRKGHDYEVREV